MISQRVVALLLLIFLSGHVLAQGVCYEYQASGSPPNEWHWTPAAAVSARDRTEAVDFGNCQGNYVYKNTMTAPAVPPSTNGTFEIRRDAIPTGGTCSGWPIHDQFIGVGTISLRVAAECPPPEEPCSEKAGQRFLGTAYGQSDAYVPPPTICLSSCSAYLKANQPWTRLGPPGDRDWLAQYEYTGAECDGEPNMPEVDTTTGPEKCAVDGVLEYCAGPKMAPGCGFINDEYTCLSAQVSKNKCHESPTGAMLCAEGTPTPPAPDSGTPGQPAAPDVQIQQTTNNQTITYNYYSSGTVANSGRTPGGEAAPGGGDLDGDGVCDANCDEDGEAGDIDMPALDDGVPGFGDSLGGFVSSVQGGPLATAIGAQTFGVGGGSCPVATFPGLHGGSLTIDMHCDLIDSYSGLIAAVFTFLWCFAAVRIFFSA